jgi:cell division protein ZapA (FtsZ GTPase activity inhibitor)
MTAFNEVEVELMGRLVRLQSTCGPDELPRAVTLLEDTFRDMERAYELRWGIPPSALDTSTWLLMGALNLAHRVARLEREASQQTQDLEQTLTKLLDDVPDENSSSPGPLFQDGICTPGDGPDT